MTVDALVISMVITVVIPLGIVIAGTLLSLLLGWVIAVLS